MKYLLRIGLLFIVLLLPILFILFFNLFGENHHRLFIFQPIDSVETKQGYQVTKAYTVPSFQLTAQDGHTFSSHEVKGKIYVANFIFTRCEAQCKYMTNQLIRVQEAFHKDKNVAIVSFTVDPEYDTIGVLKAYADAHQAISGKWFFLTGKKEDIYKLGQNGFFVSTLEDQDQLVNFIHSEKFILVDQRGWIRGFYDGTDQKEVDRLITEIKVLEDIADKDGN
jgi:protein SCO1/2